jgi:NAD-dependent dihydropyrimidine dehydrogenase PreA subunit
MAKKILKATFENRCNGCELCVYEAQRQLGKIGLSDSPIRIMRDTNSSNLYFHVVIEEELLEKLNLEEIVKICPTGVFEIIEEENDNLIR